jgi:hypothetical protein
MAPAALDPEAGANGGVTKPAFATEADAGAAFVLESKGMWSPSPPCFSLIPPRGALDRIPRIFIASLAGTWWHAGFHLTTAIVGPTVLTLPYALRGMGWALGLTALAVMAAVTFYEYSLMSRVLDHCEARGRRHIRFRELAADVLGTCPCHRGNQSQRNETNHREWSQRARARASMPCAPLPALPFACTPFTTLSATDCTSASAVLPVPSLLLPPTINYLSVSVGDLCGGVLIVVFGDQGPGGCFTSWSPSRPLSTPALASAPSC